MIHERKLRRSNRGRIRDEEDGLGMAKGANRIPSILLNISLAIAAIVAIVPLYWMLVPSFRPIGKIFTSPSLLPLPFTLDNYKTLLFKTGFPRWLLNTVIVSGGSTLIGVLVCSLAGFGFSKYEFKGKNLLLGTVLASVTIPQIVTIIPVFIIMVRIGWINTYQALIIPATANAFGIMLMKQYIQSVPNEILEAARIDGCSEPYLFLKIVLPLVKPALGALAIFLWNTSWNSYLWPLIMTRDTSMYTVPLGLTLFYTDPMNLRFDLLSAGATLSLVPVIILFLRMQSQFISGLTHGAVKS